MADFGFIEDSNLIRDLEAILFGLEENTSLCKNSTIDSLNDCSGSLNSDILYQPYNANNENLSIDVPSFVSDVNVATCVNSNAVENVGHYNDNSFSTNDFKMDSNYNYASNQALSDSSLNKEYQQIQEILYSGHYSQNLAVSNNYGTNLKQTVNSLYSPNNDDEQNTASTRPLESFADAFQKHCKGFAFSMPSKCTYMSSNNFYNDNFNNNHSQGLQMEQINYNLHENDQNHSLISETPQQLCVPNVLPISKESLNVSQKMEHNSRLPLLDLCKNNIQNKPLMQHNVQLPEVVVLRPLRTGISVHETNTRTGNVIRGGSNSLSSQQNVMNIKSKTVNPYNYLQDSKANDWNTCVLKTNDVVLSTFDNAVSPENKIEKSNCRKQNLRAISGEDHIPFETYIVEDNLQKQPVKPLSNISKVPYLTLENLYPEDELPGLDEIFGPKKQSYSSFIGQSKSATKQEAITSSESAKTLVQVGFIPASFNLIDGTSKSFDENILIPSAKRPKKTLDQVDSITKSSNVVQVTSKSFAKTISLFKHSSASISNDKNNTAYNSDSDLHLIDDSQVHKTKSPKCNTCNKMFKSVRSLIIHAKRNKHSTIIEKINSKSPNSSIEKSKFEMENTNHVIGRISNENNDNDNKIKQNNTVITEKLQTESGITVGKKSTAILKGKMKQKASNENFQERRITRSQSKQSSDPIRLRNA